MTKQKREGHLAVAFFDFRRCGLTDVEQLVQHLVNGTDHT